ncbi:MAG: hypothetical protein ACREI7_04940, partial [Myxococcota bacterium]
LSIAVMDIAAIRARLGGELGGVLGFDLFGGGRLDIDYPARTVRLTVPEAADEGALVVAGSRIRSARWRFELEHPGADWSLIERPPLPYTKLLARHASGAELELVVAEAHGLGLEQVRLSVEASLPLQVESFRLERSIRTSIAGREWLELAYDGNEDSVAWRFVTRATTTGSTIVTVTACAPISCWPEHEAALVTILDSVVLTDG